MTVTPNESHETPCQTTKINPTIKPKNGRACIA
jgi:hypothetical protein